MRTVSPKPKKGEEPARTLLDDLRLLLYIAQIALHYVVAGRPIRKKFRELQRTGGKFYVEDAKGVSPRGG